MKKPNVTNKCSQHLYTLGLSFFDIWDEPKANYTLMALLFYTYIIAYLQKKYYLFRYDIS